MTVVSGAEGRQRQPTGARRRVPAHFLRWNSAQSDKPKLDFWETANRLKSFCTKRFKGAYLNQWPSQLMDKIK